MLKSVLPLSFIVSSRFFGLFIVLPVLSLYAMKLDGANEFLVGCLVGGYAITQMFFQIPFGILSDKIGRKLSITIGLLVFVVGSFVCYYAVDIYTMLFGRLIQGVGAVGAVATAMISDYVKEEDRSKAMAIMGGSIGVAFSVSMVLSPILSEKWGLSGLFMISALLSLFCIVLLYTAVPKETKIAHHNQQNIPFFQLVFQKDIFIISVTNLMQKMLMSITFFAIPLVLVKNLGYSGSELWKVYTISMVFGFFAMGLAGFLGDAKGFSKNILLAGVVLFMASYGVFVFSSSSVVFMFGVVVFFIGFNLHEPIMQSCATKFVKSKQKGAALGIFNAFGYFGSFLGGVLGGYVLHRYGMYELAGVCFILCIGWFLMLLKLKDPRNFKNIYFDKNTNLSSLVNVKGVFDIFNTSKFSVLKYDKTIITEEKIRQIIN